MKNYAERKKKSTYDFVKQSMANFRIDELTNGNGSLEKFRVSPRKFRKKKNFVWELSENQQWYLQKMKSQISGCFRLANWSQNYPIQRAAEYFQ